MSCETILSSTAQAIDAFNAFPRAQNQLPRYMAWTANVSNADANGLAATETRYERD